MDSRNPDHIRLATLLEQYITMPHLPISERKQDYIRDVLRNAHFEVEVDDLAVPERGIHSSKAVIPWYEALEAAVKDPHTVWALHSNDRYGKFGQITRNAAELLIEAGKLRVCPFTRLSYQ